MSTAIAKNFQVGNDSTATNNFTIRQPATPDGTVRIANGNTGTTTDIVTINNSGYVGIGTSSPTNILNIYNAAGAVVELQSESASVFRAVRFSSDTVAPVFQTRKARGTLASPAAVSSGDASLVITALAYGGTNYRGVAQIQGVVDTYTSDTNISGYLSFLTNAGSTAVTERMRLTAAGSLGIGNTNADERLVVTGGISTTAQAGFNRTSGGTLDFYATDNSTRILSWGPVGVTGAISFWTGSGGIGTTEKARIDPNGNLQVQAGAVVVYQPAPASIATTATLTNANIQTGIINTTGTSYTVTMPLGTTLETLVTWAATNLGYDFSIINTASGTITMAANTGVTTLGALTIATGTSAQFRIRRTAANTFVLYRLS